ncbi:IclR family transcriptional regulator [Bacillus sp. AFS055030]|uniref:IclR family transcriptional regulator n=1 Tax=Bacillus sp. AFS055030 TaxID=2033507 RepID=UPI000BFD1ED0|nr:IclR family transcriptional regulator [Bacillus sp. AFS055030]PGL68971.1 IclR family transcriptional regulator [Bacillus sp. AFS055030]
MESKNKTVVKSMEILNLFLTYPKLSFNEIIQISGIPKTSVYRMVMSLEEMGFLDKDRDGKYALGLLFLQFGHLVSERLDIRQVALPIMHKLHDEVGEAVNLIVKDGKDAIYIEKLDTKQPVRLYTAIGRRTPLYAGACSRVILAYLPHDEKEQYLQEIDLKPIASGTITDKEQLRHVLEESLKTGYSFSRSELENHTSAIAAPIFNYQGQVIAGISIAGLDVNYQEDRLPQLIEKVKDAAQEISRKFGYI